MPSEALEQFADRHDISVALEDDESLYLRVIALAQGVLQDRDLLPHDQNLIACRVAYVLCEHYRAAAQEFPTTLLHEEDPELLQTHLQQVADTSRQILRFLQPQEAVA